MSSTIDQYREAKSQYLSLKTHAKKELMVRFHELASELYRVQRELLEDFGEKVAIPAKPKNRSAKTSNREPKIVAAEPVYSSPKLISTQKQIEDRLYELEDELRLLREP